VFISSASGTHDIHRAILFRIHSAVYLPHRRILSRSLRFYRLTPGGDKFDIAAVRREAYNFYFQDTWKATPKLTTELWVALRTEIAGSRKHGIARRFWILSTRRQTNLVPRSGRDDFVPL